MPMENGKKRKYTIKNGAEPFRKGPMKAQKNTTTRKATKKGKKK
jgi:hypothetical protein